MVSLQYFDRFTNITVNPIVMSLSRAFQNIYWASRSVLWSKKRNEANFETHFSKWYFCYKENKTIKKSQQQNILLIISTFLCTSTCCWMLMKRIKCFIYIWKMCSAPHILLIGKFPLPNLLADDAIYALHVCTKRSGAASP